MTLPGTRLGALSGVPSTLTLTVCRLVCRRLSRPSWPRPSQVSCGFNRWESAIKICLSDSQCFLVWSHE